MNLIQKNALKESLENTYNRTTPRKTDTLVYALGGLGEVGKNMYCIEHEDEILIIDAGVSFPDESLLGVDYVIPDYNYLIRKRYKKKYLIITHGHEDHIGGIPFLLKSVDIEMIYAPQFAIALINRKLEEKRMLRFAKITQIDENSVVNTDNFRCGFFNTTHSIPDSLGVLINTPNGRIVTTGDFKFDLTPVGTNADYQKMAYMGAAGVTLLMSDSTNSGVEDFSISEKKVSEAIMEIFSKTKGRLIVATFASNVHRVEQILSSAVACGRKICIFGRSMEQVVSISRKLGSIKIAEQHFLTPEELNHTPAEKTLILCTGSQGEPLAALSRIAQGTHRYIQIMPNDTIVFSSNPIPGNAASVNQVINKLFRAGANVLTNSIFNNLHTTGHASQEEQKLMLQLIKPKYFMPVHGEYKMLRQHKQTAMATGIPEENIFTCANGDVLILRDSEVLETHYRVPADDIYVDGNDSSGLSTAVLKDRKILANNGMCSVIVCIDSRTNSILCRPVIVSRGFVFIKDSQSLLREAEMVVYNALKEKMQSKITFNDIKNTIRGALEPFLYEKTHRNPIVIPVILNSKEAMAQMQQMRAMRLQKTKKEV